MRINGFMRCVCGKIHSIGGLSLTSKCPNCLSDLYAQLVKREMTCK